MLALIAVLYIFFRVSAFKLALFAKTGVMLTASRVSAHNNFFIG